MILISFFTIFSFSILPYDSTFIGKWKKIGLSGTVTDSAIMSLTLSFYHFKNITRNSKHKQYLKSINTTQKNITDFFGKDDILGVFGNIRLENATSTIFENHILCPGVYKKETSDILLICPFRNLLNLTKKNVYSIYYNTINDEPDQFEKRLSVLFSNIGRIFRDFNYNRTLNSINEDDIEAFKSQLQNRNYTYKLTRSNQSHIRKSDEKSNLLIKKKILLNRLQSYRPNITAISELDFSIPSHISNTSVQVYLESQKRLPNFSLFYFQVLPLSKYETPFDLNSSLYGYFVPDSRLRYISRTIFELRAIETDSTMLNMKARTSGAVSGLFFAVLIVLYKSAKFSDYRLTAYLTALLNTSYDLGYGNCLHSIGKLDESVYFLYSILALSYVILFCANTFRIVFRSWSSSNEAALRGLTPFEQQRRYSVFLFLCNTVYIIALVLFTNIGSFPFAFVIVFFSNWIPQIVENGLNGCKNPLPPQYFIGVTVVRLAEMAYNFLSPSNLLFIRKEQKAAFFFALVWSTCQVTTLVLQGKWGGAFFLPKNCRNRQYDYYARKPPPNTQCPICLSEIDPQNEVAVITPCNHPFHEACLRRWMMEQSVCPLCRTQIPPIIDPEPIV